MKKLILVLSVLFLLSVGFVNAQTGLCVCACYQLSVTTESGCKYPGAGGAPDAEDFCWYENLTLADFDESEDQYPGICGSPCPTINSVEGIRTHTAPDPNNLCGYGGPPNGGEPPVPEFSTYGIIALIIIAAIVAWVIKKKKK